MKVTKAKGLNTDLLEAYDCKLARSFSHRDSSRRFPADPSSRCDFIDRKSPLGHQSPSSDQIAWVAESRVTAPDRSKFEPHGVRRHPAASKSAWKRSKGLGDIKPGALTKQMFGQIGIEALCFGDCHLCQQMKVTRPPGRDPAPDSVNRPAERDPAPVSVNRQPGRNPA